MYNLIVGSINGTVGVDRMLEHTDEGVVGYLRPGGVLDPSRPEFVKADEASGC